MSEQTTTVRTDELRPGDRIWHPFDIVCFTVAHKPEPVALDFEGERGLRVTGTDDRGETVHVDVAPAYKWHRAPKATAPTTHAPLVVNTRDGICWTRRVVTSGGIALYAPESVRTCPDFVMATEAELAELGIVGSADALPMPVREEPRDLAASFDRDETADERQARWEKAAWTAGRTVDRNTLGVYMAVADAEQQKLADDWARSVTSSDAELKRLRARVAELEAAAKEIQRLHTDSPMGPCPVCIDGDAMVRGDDYTLPYPCPTARLAGAKDCDPPSQRQASHLPAEGGDAR